MQIIPLIRLHHHQILDGENNQLTVKEILQLLDKKQEVYIIDVDGIEHDEPNLDVFQKFSSLETLWIDSGPRTLGDVVDAVMAGASGITLRKNIWQKLDIPSIREVTEEKLFVETALHEQNEINDLTIFSDILGLVSFPENITEQTFVTRGYLKEIAQKFQVYIYDSDEKNIGIWRDLGVTGLLVDINKTGMFADHGI